MGGILIVGEVEQGKLRAEFWELLTVSAQLEPNAVHRRVALVGWDMAGAIEDAQRADAGEIHVIEDRRLVEPWPELHADALVALHERLDPEVTIVARTILGSELAARVAIRRGAALLHDVTEVSKDAGGITASRPVFGGAVCAAVEAALGPWIVVPRSRSFAAAQPIDDNAPPIVRHELAFGAAPQTHCGARTLQQGSHEQQLERARVLVAGGGGLGGPEPFVLLQEIADLLGGAVAASRVACDAGWISPAHQVGLTGKTVAPDLYLAVGISGATHHLAGCSSSQVIVVVNADPSAPFFRIANFGAVGDWREILPAFRDALKAKGSVCQVGSA